MKRSSNKQKRPKTEIHSLIMDYCAAGIVDIIESSVIAKPNLYDLKFSDRFQTEVLVNCLCV